MACQIIHIFQSLADLADNEGLGFADIGGGLHISRDSMDWGPNVTTNKKETFRVVYGFRGDLTDAISYEASINYGQYNREMIDTEEMIADRFFAAIDAVIDPATGEPACRSSVDPTAYPKNHTVQHLPVYGRWNARIIFHVRAWRRPVSTNEHMGWSWCNVTGLYRLRHL